MKSIRLLFVALFLCSIPGIAQQKAGASKLPKAEALAFSLKVVKTFFSGTCNDYLNCFNDTVYNFSNAEPIAVTDFKDRICESFKKAVRDKSYTYKNYIAEYKTEIVSKEGLIKQQPDIKLGNGFIPLNTDFIFLGGFPKIKTDKWPIWDDAFGFVVRKIKGKWKIISLGG